MESVVVLLLGLFLIGGVVYMVFKPRQRHGTEGRDGYFYIVGFIGLLVLCWGIGDLGRILLEGPLGIVNRYASSESELRRVSLRLSALLVALPVWAFHWIKASSKTHELMDWFSRKVYATATLVISSLALLGFGSGLVYQGLNSALGISMNKEAMSFFLPYSVVAFVVWILHFKIYREVRETTEVAPTPTV